MDPAILNYKYNDLRQVAKDLGLNNFGEYSGMPTRDQLIDSIKSYYENDCKPVVVKKKKAKKVTEELPKELETTRTTRRTTRIAAEITNDIQAEPVNEPTKEDEQEAATKKKKRTKKTDKENEPNQIEEQTKEETIAKTTKKTKTKKVEPVEEVEKETTKSKSKKKTKETEVEQPVIQTEAVPTTTESISKNQQETKTKGKKKTKETKVEQPIVATTTVEEPQQEITKSKNKKTKTKSSPTKVSKTKKTTKNKDAKTLATNSNDIIYDTNTNQSDEFQLKLDEDDDHSRQVSQQQIQPTAVVTPEAQIEQNKPEENSSLITNDENEENQPEANVTKDILNRTFDKAESETIPTSSRLVSANIKPFYIEETKHENQKTNQTESSVSCNSFYHNTQQQQSIPEETKSKAGARIVRPKQVQTVAVKVDAEKEETQKVVVELVQREAGPRIVKPPEANTDTKRKNNNETTSATKKTKETKKIPDFKAIHEKKFEKLESVSDNQQRLQQRHKLLTSVAKTPSHETKSKLPTSATISNDINKLENKPTNCSTPKITKAKSSYSVGSAQKNTNIPRLTNNAKEIAKKIIEPKTPVANEERKTISAKTPTSTIKPKTSTLLLSATKKPSYTFTHESQHLNQFNFVSGCCPTTNNLLATSSFQRRKSFDLNASLARPLNYKRHTGKLKPIEPTVPGKLGSNLLKPINMNETITKACNTTILKVASSENKRISLHKQTGKIAKTTGDENHDENTAKVKKNRNVKRNKEFDKQRNLNEPTAAAVN